MERTMEHMLEKTQKLHMFKATLMQIWQYLSLFVFIEKQYPENFALWILRILELFAREICKFLKK